MSIIVKILENRTYRQWLRHSYENASFIKRKYKATNTLKPQ